MSCVCKRQWFYRHTLVIRSININNNKNLMMLSICKEEVDNLDMKYIINNLIKNGDVQLRNVPMWWESKADIWVQMAISWIYYRFIVRFTIGLELLFITFLGTDIFCRYLVLPHILPYSLTIYMYICIDRYNISIFENCYASRACIESTAVWCYHGCYPP